MKRKPSKKACIELRPRAADRIADATLEAMYSEGYPGHPPGKIIHVPLLGEDAVALSEIAGKKFVPPDARQKKGSGKKKA